jgi:pyruvate,water dikinase
VEHKEVYWLEEIAQEYNDLVGKKSANLGEMLKVEGIRVPPGFALAIGAYEKFIRQTGADQEVVKYLMQTFPEGVSFTKLGEVSLGLRSIIESREVPTDLKEDIASHYRALCDKCGIKDVAVSVRSSGVKSHPGQYETYLSVKGLDQLLEKVVKVWSSIYNTKSISAAMRQATPIEACQPVGVCVLEMVNARSAGVCLTVHPISGDDTKAVVESNWGLGVSVVSGAVTPDRFIVDKVEMRVKEISIGQKEKQVLMKNEGISEETLPSDKQSKLSITEEEVINIVELAKKLESHFGAPQDVEWAIDSNLSSGESITLLQTRPQIGIPRGEAPLR